MPQPPFFSVVIAAFNAASWIVPTIRSALDQTYRNHEILVVGDGCTDRTGDLITATFGRAIQWKNLEQNSGGQSYPNNEGIRLARGTHIAYLGHDDVWSPRHLQQLAATIDAKDPDFAVSGAVFHGPPGSRFYQITGIFDDSSAAATEFFPPSSFAHRRGLIDRIGPWRAPGQLRAPADCDFLLRASQAGCSFASTKTITVHKFAAGHRYLSYRFPSGVEQDQMLERLRAAGGEAEVLEEVRRELADGADNPPIRYADFGTFGPGRLFHKNRRTKGLEASPTIDVDSPRYIPVERFPGGLDWHLREQDPRGGHFRWSGPNPNPRYLVNVRLVGGFQLKIHVGAFGDSVLADAVRIEVNGREVEFVRERDAAGGYIFTVEPLADGVDDGILLRFRLPRCVHLEDDAVRRRVGLALRGVEVVPLR